MVFILNYTIKPTEVCSRLPETNSATKQRKHYSPKLCKHPVQPKWPVPGQFQVKVMALCLSPWSAGKWKVGVHVFVVWYSGVQFQPPTAVCMCAVKPEIRFDQFEHVITLLSSIWCLCVCVCAKLLKVLTNIIGSKEIGYCLTLFISSIPSSWEMRKAAEPYCLMNVCYMFTYLSLV